MLCPLCGQRKARRACPALGKQICAVCCGTKRLVQIQCPLDWAYLATAREHPAAATIRQQQRDLALLVQFIRDLSEPDAVGVMLLNRALRTATPLAIALIVVVILRDEVRAAVRERSG